MICDIACYWYQYGYVWCNTNLPSDWYYYGIRLYLNCIWCDWDWWCGLILIWYWIWYNLGIALGTKPMLCQIVTEMISILFKMLIWYLILISVSIPYLQYCLVLLDINIDIVSDIIPILHQIRYQYLTIRSYLIYYWHVWYLLISISIWPLIQYLKSSTAQLAILLVTGFLWSSSYG